MGHFPLMNFWGPLTNIKSTQWIVNSAVYAAEKFQPRFTYVYLPHLDYAAQKFGPDSQQALAALMELDAVIGRLIDGFESAGMSDVLWVAASEYVISPVRGVSYPNRRLHEAGLLTLREENGTELLDLHKPRLGPGGPPVGPRVRARCGRRRAGGGPLPCGRGGRRGFERTRAGRRNLDHPLAGDVVLISKPDQWFAYYWWLDDAKAPGFCANGRYPPQAGVRPGGDVHRYAERARRRLMPASSRDRTVIRPTRRSGGVCCFRQSATSWSPRVMERFPTRKSRELCFAISTLARVRKPTDRLFPRQKKQSPRPFAVRDSEENCFLAPGVSATSGKALASAGPAAAGRVVEADVAAAAVLAAGVERLAAGLQDGAARLVAAGAGNRAAIGGGLTLADAASEVALADGQPVEGRAAGAKPARECLAEILQRGAGHLVVAGAVDLHPSLHFSNRSLQLGTTHQLAAGAPLARPAGEGATAEFAAPKNNPLSKTIVLDIESTPFNCRPACNPSQHGCF